MELLRGQVALEIEYPILVEDRFQGIVSNWVNDQIDMFIIQSQEILTDQQNYLAEYGELANSLGLLVNIQAEVSEVKNQIVQVHFQINESRGNSSAVKNKVFYWDKKNSKQVTIRDLFLNSVNTLTQLTELTRTELWKRYQNTDDQMLRATIWEGTMPSWEKFSRLIFDNELNITVFFDKYEILSGVEGVITVFLEKPKVETVFTE